MSNALIVIGIPIRPQGTVRWKWANFIHQTLRAQGIPGCVTEINFTDEGESISVAYQRLFEIGLQRGAKYILFLEDDIWMPPGGLGHLVEAIERPENKNVGAVGGVYFWRAGYNVDWPLITRTEGEPPFLDWTPGDLIEADWCGQGALLCRMDMLLADKGPWWSSEWRHEGEANVFQGAADLFFFRKIRQNGWRVLVDTRVCCEHQDIETGIVYPRDDATRARYQRVPGTEFGFEMDNHLLRSSRRALKTYGKNIHGAQSVLRHLMPGIQPSGSAPAKFEGVYPNDAVSDNGKDLSTGPLLGLNIGWGGVPVRPDIESTLRSVTPHGINWENLEHKEGIKGFDPDIQKQTQWLVDDHMLTGIPDERFDAVYCVAPGAMIQTNRGWKAIETIEVGERVLTHKGRYRRVTQTMCRDFKGTAYKFKGAGVPFMLTGEHPVFAREKGCDFKWVEASKIKKLDRIVSVLPPRRTEISRIDLSEYCRNHEVEELVVNVKEAKSDGATYDEIRDTIGVARKTAHQWVNGIKNPRGTAVVESDFISFPISRFKTPRWLPVNPSISRLIGYFVSDGTAHLTKTGGQLCFYFGDRERKYADDAANILKQFSGRESKVYKQGLEKCWRVRFLDKPLVVALSKLCRDGEGCGRKRIPQEFFDASDECLKQLVIGLFRGDGSVGKTQAYYATCHIPLATQVHQLLGRLGVASRIHKVKNAKSPAGNLVDMFHVSISGSSLRRLLVILGEPKRASLKRKEDLTRHVVGEHGIELCALKSEPIPYSGPVYNFSVEEDESYTVNGIAVHNCHHVLEHIPHALTVETLREWLRVLKPKGRLMVFVPDFQYVAQWIAEGKLDTTIFRCPSWMPGMESFDVTPRKFFWGAQRYPGDAHMNGFTLQSLRDAAFEAGCAAEEVKVTQDGQYALGLLVWKGRSLYPRSVDQVEEREIVRASQRGEVVVGASGNGKNLEAPVEESILVNRR